MSDQDPPPEQRSRTASVVGLGDMGSALARAFLANDHSVTVWNRTADKAAALVQAGARQAKSVAEAAEASEVTVWNRTADKAAALVQAGARQAKSVAEAAEASEVTVLCVLDYDVSASLLDAPTVAEKLRGKTLVQLTTGTPRQARETESWATRHGISYVDGAIMSYPSGIGTPDCTILYAGPQAVFEAHKGLLGSLAGNSVFLGERIGNASTLDSSLLTFVFSAELGFLHGAALCESEGFPIGSYHETAAALISLLVADTAKASSMISKANYAGREASLEVFTSAFGHMLRFSDEAGVDRACIEPLLSLAKRAIAAGYGGDEFPALFEVLRQKTGPKTT